MFPSAIRLPIMLSLFCRSNKRVLHSQTVKQISLNTLPMPIGRRMPPPIQVKAWQQKDRLTYWSPFTCFHQAEDPSNAPSWHASSALHLLERKEHPLRKRKKQLLILHLNSISRFWILIAFPQLCVLGVIEERRAVVEMEGVAQACMRRWWWAIGAS